MTPAPSAADPVELVRQLDVDQIRQRLEALEQDRRALLVLLRAAHKTRKRRPKPLDESKEAADAS